MSTSQGHCVVLVVKSHLRDCSPAGFSAHGISQARILEWGSHVLLQGIFLVQGLDLGLSHWQESSLPLSHQGIRRSFRLVVAVTKRQMNKYISDWIPVTCTRIAGSREGGPGHVSCGSKQWLSQPHWLCSITVSLVKLLNLSVSQHLHLYNLF